MHDAACIANEPKKRQGQEGSDQEWPKAERAWKSEFWKPEKNGHGERSKSHEDVETGTQPECFEVQAQHRKGAVWLRKVCKPEHLKRQVGRDPEEGRHACWSSLWVHIQEPLERHPPVLLHQLWQFPQARFEQRIAQPPREVHPVSFPDPALHQKLFRLILTPFHCQLDKDRVQWIPEASSVYSWKLHPAEVYDQVLYT